MYHLKKLLTTIFLLLLFTGCVHKIDKQGVTLAVSEDSLNESVADSFPIKEDFILGSIKLYNPNLALTKDSQRIKATVDMQVKTLLTPTQKGAFTLSGVPFFEAKSKSIFLKEIKIEELSFASFKMGKTFSNTLLKELEPMINKAFEEMPIYKIKEDSFHGSFVKSMKIEGSELLVTYGF